MPTTNRRGSRRGNVLRTAIRTMLVLRRGRWTAHELAGEIGVHWRTAYRLVEQLRDAGVTIEVSREREGGQRNLTRYYRVPADPLRKLMKL
jgi:predicted DNA-binding transcriptional regulator YafY